MLRQNSVKRRFLFKTLRYCLIFAVAGVLALVNTLIPFRSMLPALALSPRKEGELRLHFVDVGQGDCTLIEFPEGDVLVVDAGGGGFETDNHLIRYVKGLNPKSLSYVATHADYDHVGGLSTLIELFGATEIYLPALGSELGAYKRFAAAAQSAGCELKSLTRYDVIARPSGAYCVCLSPYSMGETDTNESSCVLYLKYAGVRVLLCSDISSERELKMMREYGIDDTLFYKGEYAVTLDDIDILKVAHHGSASSSAEDWMELINPSVAVISCGRGNRYGHPSQETVARLSGTAQIYRTDELGDITVGIADGAYHVNI